MAHTDLHRTIQSINRCAACFITQIIWVSLRSAQPTQSREAAPCDQHGEARQPAHRNPDRAAVMFAQLACDKRIQRARSPRPLSWGIDLHRLWRATLNSWHGIRAAAKSEAAFREELVALAFSVPVAFFITIEAWKRLALT